MGLDVGSVSFSYGGFNRFREMLAKEIGYNLDDFEGFGGDKSFKEMKDDIKWLLDHSDCDGHITPKRCGRIAPRLRDITKTWEKCGDSDKEWYRDMAVYLAEDMESCCKYNEPLVFR